MLHDNERELQDSALTKIVGGSIRVSRGGTTIIRLKRDVGTGYTWEANVCNEFSCATKIGTKVINSKVGGGECEDIFEIYGGFEPGVGWINFLLERPDDGDYGDEICIDTYDVEIIVE